MHVPRCNESGFKLNDFSSMRIEKNPIINTGNMCVIRTIVLKLNPNVASKPTSNCKGQFHNTDKVYAPNPSDE